MTVSELFIKVKHGEPMLSVASIEFDTSGIVGNVECPPLRQLLLASSGELTELGLVPGDLRENVLIDCPELYSLESGTVLRIGSALIRLTFHCEPCKHILEKVSRAKILHKRGYLGSFLNAGTIRVYDGVEVLGREYEHVPYELSHRLEWYLSKSRSTVGVLDLLHEIGLSRSYARAIPNLLKKVAPELRDRVRFANPRHSL